MITIIDDLIITTIVSGILGSSHLSLFDDAVVGLTRHERWRCKVGKWYGNTFTDI